MCWEHDYYVYDRQINATMYYTAGCYIWHLWCYEQFLNSWCYVVEQHVTFLTLLWSVLFLHHLSGMLWHCNVVTTFTYIWEVCSLLWLLERYICSLITVPWCVFFALTHLIVIYNYDDCSTWCSCYIAAATRPCLLLYNDCWPVILLTVFCSLLYDYELLWYSMTGIVPLFCLYDALCYTCLADMCCWWSGLMDVWADWHLIFKPLNRRYW